MSSGAPRLSIVVPAYQSADCLPALVSAIEAALVATGWTYELVLTDDASPDDTWRVIEKLASQNPWIVAQRHRRNFGQDNAIMSGLRVARGKIVVIMDDDLQHDPRDIPRLCEHLEKEGLDIVYANYEKRRHRAWKNLGSYFSGKVAEWLLDKPPHIYLSPFKAVRATVAREILRYTGPGPYVDGLLLETTRRLGQVSVAHRERFSGSSTYTVLKSVQVWSRLAFSFSVQPLRVGIWIGSVVASLGLLGTVAVVAMRILNPAFSDNVAGWASLMTSLLFFSGIQIILLGLLGEYVGRSFLSLNRSPQSIIAETANLRPQGREGDQ